MSDTDLSRRSLLIQGGLLAAAALPAAAATATPSTTPATPLAPPDKQPPGLQLPKTEKKVNFAVMGLGELALQQVLPAFALCQHARPFALISGHADKAKAVAEKYGIESKNVYSYDAFDTIAHNGDIDVVYNILPNHLHAEYTIRGFKAGKHVLCEKPMAPTVKECEDMIAAGKAAGKKLMIAYRLHYEPYNLKATELLRSGAYGKVKLIEAQDCQNTYAPNIRLSNETAGGPLGDVGIYCLNATRYLTGEEPTEVSGQLFQPENSDRFHDVAESVMFTLRFPSGVMAMCGCSFGTGKSNRFRVTCDNGYVQLDPAFGYSGQKLTAQQGSTTYEFEVPVKNHFTAEMDHFAECVLNNTDPKTPGEEGLRDIKIITKIKQAIRDGKTVKL